jgi:hypothetical protein
MIIDDYYDPILFQEMCDEIRTFIRQLKNGSKLHSKKTTIGGIHNPIRKLPKTSKCIGSRVITEDILKEFPQYRDYKKLELATEVNICLDDLSYPIHDEAKSKVLSAVTYLFPEVSRGTLLYDTDKNFVAEVEWKANRTLIFAPIDNVTWHAYKSIPGSYRITVNMFLIK